MHYFGEMVYKNDVFWTNYIKNVSRFFRNPCTAGEGPMMYKALLLIAYGDLWKPLVNEKVASKKKLMEIKGSRLAQKSFESLNNDSFIQLEFWIWAAFLVNNAEE